MIALRGISNYVLHDVSLDISDAELMVLVGPSGAGKTTLLNVVAGLTSYTGQVLLHGTRVDGLPPCRRCVGYVFQDLLLFPHLTVEQNLLLAMTRLDIGQAEKIARAGEILRTFRMAHLTYRYPRQLSGGEQQRVALARAVVARPKILLLDEPFANLDFRTARYLRQELKKQQQRLGLTTLFVTHNLAEARELGDRIAVLQHGRLEQIGPVQEILFNHAWAAGDFLERPNVLQCCDCRCLENGLVEVRWAGLKVLVSDEGRPVSRLSILPRDIYISSLPAPGPPINRFTGTISAIHHDDGLARIEVAVGTETLRVEMTPENLDALDAGPGEQVHGILKLRSLRGL